MRQSEHKSLTQGEANRTERWKALEGIAARNADLDPEEVERDIVEEIAAMRQELRDQAHIDQQR